MKKAVMILLLLSLTLITVTACSPAVEAPAEEAPAAEEPVAEQPEAEAPAEDAPGESADTPADDAAPTSDTTFTISEGTVARFLINETLVGNDITVIGENTAVSGRVTVNPADAAAAQISTIEIDPGQFITDNNNRNGAIRRFVLQTNQYTDLAFTPTGISGLPASMAVGDTAEVEISGDLFVHGTTVPATFPGTLTYASADRIEGSFSQEFLWADLGVNIPQPPQVSFIADTLILELDLVAVAE